MGRRAVQRGLRAHPGQRAAARPRTPARSSRWRCRRSPTSTRTSRSIDAVVIGPLKTPSTASAEPGEAGLSAWRRPWARTATACRSARPTGRLARGDRRCGRRRRERARLPRRCRGADLRLDRAATPLLALRRALPRVLPDLKKATRHGVQLQQPGKVKKGDLIMLRGGASWSSWRWSCGRSSDDPMTSDLAALDFCYLTTTGRVTGNPHRIEIWFALHEENRLPAGGGPRSERLGPQPAGRSRRDAPRSATASARPPHGSWSPRPMRTRWRGGCCSRSTRRGRRRATSRPGDSARSRSPSHGPAAPATPR